MEIHETKMRIFLTSTELFATKGYHNVTVKEIAETVKIRQATIYYHYAAKEDILTDVFDYYEANRNKSLPNPEELLTLVGTEPPQDTLLRTIAVYPDDSQNIMGKALRIAEVLSTVNDRAAKISDSLLYTAGNYAKPLLERMLALDIIEPIDVDGFCNLFNSFCHSAAVRHYTDRALTNEEYISGLKLLFRLVKAK